MREMTTEGRRVVDELAHRHGVSSTAVQALLTALAEGGGTQAQFNHPELGGAGQWMAGGMLMIGDMFNQGLKARVDALCGELSRRLRTEALLVPAEPTPAPRASAWPAALGVPASSGAQGDVRYAYFPGPRRLVLERGGHVTTYDTGEHRISGVSQQQGPASSLTFVSQLGPVRLDDLSVVAPAAPGPAPTSAAPAERSASSEDPLALLERLAELHKKGVLTSEEFTAKKAELLRRL
jgi:hypothetical protein